MQRFISEGSDKMHITGTEMVGTEYFGAFGQSFFLPGKEIVIESQADLDYSTIDMVKEQA